MVIEPVQNHILVLAGQTLCPLHQIDHRRCIAHIRPMILDATAAENHMWPILNST
jgi:hypothetical protein